MRLAGSQLLLVQAGRALAAADVEARLFAVAAQALELVPGLERGSSQEVEESPETAEPEG